MDEMDKRQDIGTPAGRAGGSKKQKKHVKLVEKLVSRHLRNIEA